MSQIEGNGVCERKKTSDKIRKAFMLQRNHDGLLTLSGYAKQNDKMP